MSGSGAEPGHGADQGPYFFLSYAHSPRIDPDEPGDPNELVVRLCRDLSQEILNLTDLPVERAGFMDRELRPGHEWPRRITTALATCRVFIPLYSPRYFSSENCGKEWFAFHKRQLEHEAGGGRRPEAIVPVLWVPVPERNLPEVARSLQFDHHRLGEIYARDGFSHLIKINRFHDDYHTALRALAEHIVEVAAHQAPDPAPDKVTDYANLECAWGTAERRAADSRRLHVTIVTDDFHHLPQRPVPRDPVYYRPGMPTGWNPYQPESHMPVAEYTANMARGMGFVPEVTWFDEASAPGSAPSEDPGVAIVDPWAALDPARGERLRRFGGQSWIQPMVPWNIADAQTVQHEAELRDALSQALPAMPTPLSTLRMFGDHLPKAIHTAVRNYLRQAQPHPPKSPDGSAPGRTRLLDTENALPPDEYTP